MRQHHPAHNQLTDKEVKDSILFLIEHLIELCFSEDLISSHFESVILAQTMTMRLIYELQRFCHKWNKTGWPPGTDQLSEPAKYVVEKMFQTATLSEETLDELFCLLNMQLSVNPMIWLMN